MEENNFINNNQKIKMSRKIFLNDQGPYKRKHEMLLRDLRECLNPREKKKRFKNPVLYNCHRPFN